MIYAQDKDEFYDALAELRHYATNKEIAELLFKTRHLSYNDLYDIIAEICKLDDDCLDEVLLRLDEAKD